MEGWGLRFEAGAFEGCGWGVEEGFVVGKEGGEVAAEEGEVFVPGGAAVLVFVAVVEEVEEGGEVG